MITTLRLAVFCLATLGAPAASAQHVFDLPLTPADPAQPLTVVVDDGKAGASLRPSEGTGARLALTPFKYEAAKGPINLVVDLAGVSTGSGRGSVLVEIGIECPESGTPCAIPITKSTVEFRREFMAEQVTVIAGVPTPALIGRAGHDYAFDDETLVAVTLDVIEADGLDPRALRARLVYGKYNDDPLPGQATRGGLLKNILFVVGGLTLLVLVFLRKR